MGRVELVRESKTFEDVARDVSGMNWLRRGERVRGTVVGPGATVDSVEPSVWSSVERTKYVLGRDFRLTSGLILLRGPATSFRDRATVSIERACVGSCKGG
jgi:hypothetical protein